MPLRKSSIPFGPYFLLRTCMSHIKAILTQIVLILLVANSLQAAAIFDPASPEITVDEARSLGAKTADNLMYLGDIILYPTEEGKFAIGGDLWPDGTLVYEFSSGLEDVEEQSFRDACNGWTLSSSPIICRERTTESNYVLVSEHDGSGCGGDSVNVSCSALGMVGGSQDLKIYKNHWSKPHVLQHEIGHALGLIHEHSRADRGSFVHIIYGNVKPGREKAFDPEPSAFSTEYDLQSIMHYGNCNFSKHDSCTLATKAFHTIMPVACHLEQVGGRTITALDYDSVRSAYASAIYSLYPQNRERKCGIHDYSLKQMDETCAPDCETIGDTKYKSVETVYKSWCSPRPAVPCQTYCPLDKTCFDEWTDYDYYSCGFFGTLTELWVKCGCAYNHVVAECADTAGSINLSKLQDLLDSSVPRDLNTGRFVKRVLAIQENGNLENELYAKIGDFLIDNYNHRGFAKSLKNLTCLVKIFMAGKLVVNPMYKLSLSSFQNLADQTGLRTNSL